MGSVAVVVPVAVHNVSNNSVFVVSSMSLSRSSVSTIRQHESSLGLFKTHSFTRLRRMLTTQPFETQ